MIVFIFVNKSLTNLNNADWLNGMQSMFIGMIQLISLDMQSKEQETNVSSCEEDSTMYHSMAYQSIKPVFEMISNSGKYTTYTNGQLDDLIKKKLHEPISYEYS